MYETKSHNIFFYVSIRPCDKRQYLSTDPKCTKYIDRENSI